MSWSEKQQEIMPESFTVSAPDTSIRSRSVVVDLVSLQVLVALRQYHLTLKLEKFVFFSRSINYLERKISCKGVKPERKKIEAAVRMMEPQNVKEFTVVTDCSNLSTTFTKRDLILRVGQWWLEVQEYTFNIKYRSGPRMSHVDAISRYQQEVVEVNQINLTEGDWILAAQLQDKQLCRIRAILQAKEKISETRGYFEEYVLKDGKVYRKLPAWVVPKCVRWQICRLCHDQAGHAGVENTIKRIQESYCKAMTEAKLLTEVQNNLGRFDLKQLRVKVKECITANQAKQKEDYDRVRRKPNEYKKGRSGVSAHH
ncbi:hypothetical protein ILUMI_21752 [Ignelater luminosus]|uniref:RNA-directed DNA polymerase n=1 Tax=Ignelater luminosus TaxID=2038154 RepID=A0A8K0G3K2_IGNLU|nr:hypothetical protein ILUMI_21752 [Ignelater luminosus]